MASLGLKLFYLRTRERQLSQKQVAEAVGVRQATISNLEQGSSEPRWALLVDLCRFYDVTPTFLADQKRGVVPRPTERWGLRDGLVTLGMSIQIDADAAVELASDTLICELQPGARFYDQEAAAVVCRLGASAAGKAELARLATRSRVRERGLEQELRADLARHPRQRQGPSQ